ncbi:MAG: iron-sulfur cluster assembly accessory protein [Cyclobacteriaceae bacterium]|nr:iron-sulfur cluster assembly accessory protein [Cyclobacteriaceae bacterium]
MNDRYGKYALYSCLISKKASCIYICHCNGKIRQIREKKQIDTKYALRLGIKPAGCGVASYLIGFDTIGLKDELFELEGLQIVVEKAQLMYVAGKTVDWVTDIDGEQGFVFREDK